jgi:peptidoglycan hydrolase-like protein with peptidoglycan-binding domain
MGGKLPPGSEKYLVSDSPIDNSKKPSSIIGDLFLTSQGSDVKLLQEFLINQNKGQFSKQLQQAGVTGYFGMVTKQALSEYQKSIGIKPSNGYFGQITKSFLVSLGY